MKARSVLIAVLAFGAVIVLVVVFFVSVGLGAINYVTSCGINPGLVFAALASSPSTGAQLSPTVAATPAVSVSSSAIPVIPAGGLFSGFQANPQFSVADQAEIRKNAALIVAIGAQRPEKFSDRDIAIAVATSIQESNLINLPFLNGQNDHDSLGLFQQRPSVESWGTATEIMDPTHAINAFYDRMSGVAERDKMTMIDVAIKVQIPSKTAYYSRWKWDDLANEIVGIYKSFSSGSENICSQAAGVYGSSNAHLPLDPGYYVTEGFDDPGYGQDLGTKPHIGVDLVYDSDTLNRPVYAAFSGTVIESGYGSDCSGNNTVMILSKEGFETGYLHMIGTSILVKEGDAVAAGQQIGAIGSCGQSTGPHLHFEITPGTNREPWLSQLHSVQKYGQTWLDPAAFMAHYSVTLLP